MHLVTPLSCITIARTRGCVRNNSETYETVTGLHDRRSRDCSPLTPIECVSMSFRTHPCVLAFIKYIMFTNEIDMVLANEFNTKKLLVVT